MAEPTETLLDRFYKHLAERPDDVYLTQPLGGGEVRAYTFAEIMDEASRMATYLRSLDLPPQSKIAMVSKNCAHFFEPESTNSKEDPAKVCVHGDGDGVEAAPEAAARARTVDVAVSPSVAHVTIISLGSPV